MDIDFGNFLGQAHVYSIIFKNNSNVISGTNFGFDYPKLTNLCSYRYNKHFERYTNSQRSRPYLGNIYRWRELIQSDENSTRQ
jgi:hypothetical protein